MFYKLLTISVNLIAVLSTPALDALADITLQTVASNLKQPLYYADPNDGTGRTFIVEKEGRIKILKGGAILDTPLLDIGDKISTEGERGLLGLAFDPAFKSNGRFFVFYTRKSDGMILVSSFTVSSTNKNVANRRSEKARIKIPHAENSNHNGGQLAFGSDGFLYVGVGDGGGGGDPQRNAQNKSVLLGKILRIGVSGSSGHTIPNTNPFRGVKRAKGEIYALGLRNPWRFSFDKPTKRLFVADVGQNEVEEVDIVNIKANLGWNIMEGNQCFSPSSGCSTRGLSRPITTYGRTEGSSITGGYVYRGAIQRLKGKYIFGDFESGTIWTLTQNSDRTWTRSVLLSSNRQISSFGQDSAGEVYVVDFSNGEVLKIAEN